MAKRKKAPEFHTKWSWADEYIDERRTGQFRRVQVYHPMVEDRRQAGNIPFEDPTLHRTWRGKVPTIARPAEDKQLRGAFRLDESQFIRVSQAGNQKNIGRFEIGTSSGIEPLEDPPFTPGPQQGYPTDNPLEVNYKFENDATEAEFVIFGPLDTENMRGERYPYRFNNPEAYSKDTRMSNKISEGFDNPTEPSARYPKKGSFRLRGSNTLAKK